ncbi:ECF RNA polymerase sigma factor SigW [Kordia antarctica]|uniref:ECF RNA polymerase sigma factor SigW n=1 Tax=Kordia antarctica TaxID=1218801 RepID=A0A7L4ZDE9_9FLAO|nr:sigma-70 family RNA polymerase sigma factor [Kordia antarctica]QHI34725.1 ECF RNA polymerase sigma factor SigW [Kordia antarctica]
MKQADFLHMILPFKDKLYRLAKRLLVSSEEAEDATQEVLLKLWSKKTKIETYTNVEAFAMTMTKNYCLDKLKSKQASNLKLVHSNYTDENTSLERELELKDSVNFVHEIMNQLPDQQKIIIQLRDIEQYDFEEIAKVVNMNPTAIRVALSRARKYIREELTKKHNYGVS